jgi:hypothetical protein
MGLSYGVCTSLAEEKPVEFLTLISYNKDPLASKKTSFLPISKNPSRAGLYYRPEFVSYSRYGEKKE